MSNATINTIVRDLVRLNAARAGLLREVLEECWRAVHEQARDVAHASVGERLFIDNLSGQLQPLLEITAAKAQAAATEAVLPTRLQVVGEVVGRYVAELDRPSPVKEFTDNLLDIYEQYGIDAMIELPPAQDERPTPELPRGQHERPTAIARAHRRAVNGRKKTRRATA